MEVFYIYIVKRRYNISKSLRKDKETLNYKKSDKMCVELTFYISPITRANVKDKK